MNFNPYSVLDVPMSADFELLRATYRRLARENHPDVAPDKILATERMAQINRAWAILSDAEKRAAFDARWNGRSLEQARIEAWQREVTQREMARIPARRTKTATTTTGPRPAKKVRRGIGAKIRAKLGWGVKPRLSTRPANSFNNVSNSEASPQTSPRALRLIRRVTLASRLWRRDGNAKSAVEICRAVLLADGRNVPARELLSEIFASQGRLEIAVMMLDQAIQITPDDQFLRRKRDHLERARFPGGVMRPFVRPSLWQKLRAKLRKS